MYIDDQIKDYFDKNKICYKTVYTAPSRYMNLFVLNYNLKLAKDLGALIKKNDNMDFYITLADESLPVIKYIKDLNKFFIYISNGDLSLLYFNKGYINRYGLIWKYLSRSMVKHIWQNAELSKMYDLLLGNSAFTSNLMSFIYNMPFSGYVYPPIGENIHPTNYKENTSYAIAILRNEMEPAYHYIKSIAKKINVKVIGGANVENAENLGFIPENRLIDLYSGANVTLSLNPQEFFGYPIVESLRCKTPVMAFNTGGASEIIKNYYNGWLINDSKELAEKLYDIIKMDNQEMRENALKSSNNYTIEASTKKLLNYLNGVT
ncbi:MAG: glycosyltransferase [Thermoplasmata archaeon]